MMHLPKIVSAGMVCVAMTACGQKTTAENAVVANSDTTMPPDGGMRGPSALTANNTSSDEASDTQNLVNEAVAEVQKMKTDPKLVKLMQRAKGIYIVPEFGRGALLVGGRGGAGVVLANQDGNWTSPAFYDFGALSVGAQAGGSGGQLAFLLMTDDAVSAFMSGNKVSLNAESGLSIINYSANAQESWGKGDIIMWSDTEGAYAGATLSVTDLNWDDDNNRAYYSQGIEPNQILTGKVTKAGASKLRQMLP